MRFNYLILLIVVVIGVCHAAVADEERNLLGGFLRKIGTKIEDRVKAVIDQKKTSPTDSNASSSSTLPEKPTATDVKHESDTQDQADAKKKDSDSDLQKLQDAWKAAGDLWEKAKTDLSKDSKNVDKKKLVDELKKKLDDARDKLADGTTLWRNTRSEWDKTKTKFSDLKKKWETVAAPIVDKVGKAIKAGTDVKQTIDGLKKKADMLKAGVDSAWKDAVAFLKKALAELLKDPNSAAKKEAVVVAQSKLDAATAAKKVQDENWNKANKKWSDSNAAWQAGKSSWGPAMGGSATTAGLTSDQCSTVLTEKSGIDEPMRMAHREWVKAYREFKRASSEVDKAPKDATKLAALAKAQSAFQQASADMDTSVADWDNRTSGWCDKGMYCAKTGTVSNPPAVVRPPGAQVPTPPAVTDDSTSGSASINPGAGGYTITSPAAQPSDD